LSSPALLSVLQVRHGGDESILTLSVASTLRIASVDATLSAHFWAAGRLPLLSSRLSADPSARRAVVRLCLGDTLDAQEARSQGLLDLVVEEAALDATAMDFAVRAQRTDRALLTESLNLLQSGARENHAYDSDALHRWTQDERDVL
jgi:enoyl-CoA hydratase/carnithine racemase